MPEDVPSNVERSQEPQKELSFGGAYSLRITFDLQAGVTRFEWSNAQNEQVAVGVITLRAPEDFLPCTLNYTFVGSPGHKEDYCFDSPASIRGLLNRVRKTFPVAPGSEQVGLLSATDLGMAQAGRWLPLELPPRASAWSWLGRQLYALARISKSKALGHKSPEERGKVAHYVVACELLEVEPDWTGMGFHPPNALLDLAVIFNTFEGCAEMRWSKNGTVVVSARIRSAAPGQFTWELQAPERPEKETTRDTRNEIRAVLERWLQRVPTSLDSFTASWLEPDRQTGKPVLVQSPPLDSQDIYPFLEENFLEMGAATGRRFSRPDLMASGLEYAPEYDFERYNRQWERKQQKLAEEQMRRRETMARLAEERRIREAQKAQARAKALAEKHAREVAAVAAQQKEQTQARQREPVPPVPLHFHLPSLEFQETAFPLSELKSYRLREAAARWWISNQTDDLLCLPHCRIQHLNYQLSTALRVLGPLRGRALLSDEVGLGKTIEAGLVIKELLTRGMVKRFLVLTVPSLVDQWEEELSDKFGLQPATTNQSVAREAPEQFWAHDGIVASLHTLKQAAHLEVARQLKWDVLVVDEAHHLRNRDSLAWQAVSVLPRQFLLLLTATPVQNSLEELYNLVTLLQPGHLPSPKEFRARFIDPKRPRLPKEPEELRRLLGQVMIRNTRANAGIHLPPRRAETVLFEPAPEEKAFWQEWESEFRVCLAELHPSQASLWGRLLLQAGGSSPAAWRASASRFPKPAAAAGWVQRAPLTQSWEKKCALIPSLARGEGGAVIFTQFLETQAGLAAFLKAANIPTFVINGQTPAAERQPITEDFHRQGGALLLTHSGTEGRNLQFCHTLVNFDLPWNPMEIEQRIGRLHRLGQKHPVRIYNLVQAGTLQEHLVDILQEKLNLFELVVGETGLVLGERFSSDEFAEEVLRRWRESEGRVGEALATLGDELAAAHHEYLDIKKLDETLFSKDYESV